MRSHPDLTVICGGVKVVRLSVLPRRRAVQKRKPTARLKMGKRDGHARWRRTRNGYFHGISRRLLDERFVDKVALLTAPGRSKSWPARRCCTKDLIIWYTSRFGQAGLECSIRVDTDNIYHQLIPKQTKFSKQLRGNHGYIRSTQRPFLVHRQELH